MPTRFLLSLLLCLAMCGCSVVVNTEFVRPDQAGLVLGSSTEADLLRVEGAPQTETVTTVSYNGGDHPQFGWAKGAARRYDLLGYNVARRNNFTGQASGRTAQFLLADGRLYGWQYQSSDPAASTDFDETAAQTLLGPGDATRARLVALLGPPGGLRLYPLTSAPGMSVASWAFIGPNKATGKRVAKSVDILFGSDDRIVSYNARQADAPLPAPARTTVVPIIIR